MAFNSLPECANRFLTFEMQDKNPEFVMRSLQQLHKNSLTVDVKEHSVLNNQGPIHFFCTLDTISVHAAIQFYSLEDASKAAFFEFTRLHGCRFLFDAIVKDVTSLLKPCDQETTRESSLAISSQRVPLKKFPTDKESFLEYVTRLATSEYVKDRHRALDNVVSFPQWIPLDNFLHLVQKFMDNNFDEEIVRMSACVIQRRMQFEPGIASALAINQCIIKALCDVLVRHTHTHTNTKI